MDHTPIIIENIINATASDIWLAITDQVQMKLWYFDLPDFKAEPGFTFQFIGAGKEGEKYLHLCEVQEAVVNKKLSYTWRYDGYEGNSLVTFDLLPAGAKTKITLTHSGLETFPSTTNVFAKENFVEGWTHIINKALKEYLEKS